MFKFFVILFDFHFVWKTNYSIIGKEGLQFSRVRTTPDILKIRENVLAHFVSPSRWMQDLFIVELKQSNIFLI